MSKQQAVERVQSSDFKDLVMQADADQIEKELDDLIEGLTGQQKFIVLIIIVVTLVVVLLASIAGGVVLTLSGVTEIGWLTGIPATALGGLIGLLGARQISE